MPLIQRKEVWLPTIQGWLFIFVLVLALMLFIANHAHRFLAPNFPIKADVLVVEGWMEDYALKSAMQEFKRGGYQKLITTGTPLEQGYYLSEYKTNAELSAATLIALGFPPDQLVAVPAPEVLRNRTAASAIALREWISQSNLKIKSINLYSSDVHARRSWLLFKQALAPKIQVGVISVDSDSYNPKQWWIYSAGVRSIISEAIAYLYARLVSWNA
ncbi:YdcF family protein [Allocoleopsis sp.]|uniref:YdcF family protein n=1 Tax=Allocoleopsis sp. TaxID=3088169 RepID=UPI002FD4589A